MFLKMDTSTEIPGGGRGAGGGRGLGTDVTIWPDKSVYQNYYSTVSDVTLFLKLPFYY